MVKWAGICAGLAVWSAIWGSAATGATYVAMRRVNGGSGRARPIAVACAAGIWAAGYRVQAFPVRARIFRLVMQLDLQILTLNDGTKWSHNKRCAKAKLRHVQEPGTSAHRAEPSCWTWSSSELQMYLYSCQDS